MIDPRYVTAHGKRFLVETLETPRMAARRARKPKRGEEFAIVPLQWAAGIAKDTNTKRSLVWIALLYLSWKEQSKTFPVSNVALAQFGISRYIKLRTLERLAAIGRITVQQRNGCAPLVTLIGFPDPIDRHPSTR
jgi:hypothetical protein